MKKIVKILTVTILTISILTGCSVKKFDPANIKLVQLEMPATGQDMATVNTNMGAFKMVLYPEYAPKAVENFKALANEGYYNGQSVYELQPYALATGSPSSDGKEWKTISGKQYGSEYSNDLWHFPGAVSVISDKENKGDSRFVVNGTIEINDEVIKKMKKAQYPPQVIENYKKLGGAPYFDVRLAIFGQVIEGYDVVKNIFAQPISEGSLRPVTDIIIEKIELGSFNPETDGKSYELTQQEQTN